MPCSNIWIAIFIEIGVELDSKALGHCRIDFTVHLQYCQIGFNKSTSHMCRKTSIARLKSKAQFEIKYVTLTNGLHMSVDRDCHGLPRGFRYLWIDWIVPTNFLNFLSPWSSKSVKNWLSYDPKLFWGWYLQNWCHSKSKCGQKWLKNPQLTGCGFLSYSLWHLHVLWP